VSVDEVVLSREGLEERQVDILNALIAKYKVTLGREGLGCTHLYEHKIDTGDAKPVRSRFHPYSPKMRKHLYKGIDEFLKLNTIEPSTSSWCSPVLRVPKSNGEYLWVVDLREVIKVAKADAYSPNRVSEILDQLRDAKGTLGDVKLKKNKFS